MSLLCRELERALTSGPRFTAIRSGDVAVPRARLWRMIERAARESARVSGAWIAARTEDAIALTAEVVGARLAGKSVLVHSPGTPPALRRLREAALEPGAAAESIVFFSSGSVGPGKAVPLRDPQILFAATAYPDDAVRESDRVALGVPVSHVFGFVRGVLHALLSGAELVVFPPGRDPVGAAEAAGGTIAMLSSRQLLLAARVRRPSSLRAVLTGGAPVPESAITVVERHRGVPVRVGYGLTETAGLGTRQGFARPRRAGTSGPPAPGMRVEVVAPDGEPAAAGREGEIRIRGPSVFDGYAGAGEESPFDARGRLCTGDVGLLDPEGELIVRGRAGLLLRSQGRVLCAEEVETAALENPSVLDAAAVPLGETFGLLVVPSGDSRAMRARLRRGMAARLPPFGRPRRWRFVESIPRSAAGKIDREAVVRLFESVESRPVRLPGSAGAPSARPVHRG